MTKNIILIICFCFNINTYATSEQEAYLHRFTTYTQWNQQLPAIPTPEFLAFIDEKKPLSQKLRDKWLYELAKKEYWSMYLTHYQPSTDTSLQCYALFAAYVQGTRETAILGAKKQWLTGGSLPPACDKLFLMMFKEQIFDGSLVTKRIALALEQRNYSLASYLLKKYKPTDPNNDQTLALIYKNPSKITQLVHNELHGDFYTYGLNHLLTRNMDHAAELWNKIKHSNSLNEKQEQSFLSTLALYKAVRDKPDAPAWFDKVKTSFYSQGLLEWQIRYALKHHQWKRISTLIQRIHDKDSPCWQYWLARAEEQTNQKEMANQRYEKLSKSRNYYGFLANIRLKKPFQFEAEKHTYNKEALNTYTPILNQMNTLYKSNQMGEASRLVNDFSSELPKEDKSNLAEWIFRELGWVGKSVYISNTPELNNQLDLRFPLAHEGIIKQQARTYNLKEAYIYAIIRQESAFREDVVSYVGAHGLMQLMPNTAKLVAHQHKIAYNDKKQLFISQKNINLGAAYLRQLGNRFDNHPLLMAAAYNAGPRQVYRWISTNPLKEADIWIETLPFQETRNYLKNIMAFYAVYQYQMKEKPDLSPFMRPYKD